MLEAGKLRHRVTVQARTNTQGSVTGATDVSWADVPQWVNIAAAIEPLSARDLIAAQAQQSPVTSRVTIRRLAGLTAQHRLMHNGRVLSIEGVLPDPDSGLEWMTLAVAEGLSDGE